MSAPDQYQAVVIGSGQGGKPLSVALAAAGWRTAILEREHVGGTCVNEGCTPTKTMVASARVAYLTRRAADYGVETGNIRMDMARVRKRKRDIVDSFRNRGQAALEKTKNLDLIFGEASFAGPKSLAVRLQDGTRRTLAAETIFIDAGCRPAIPQLDGLKDVPYLNSTSIMELDSVPEHLLVLGGGYVGLEFGQMFRRFGSCVSIVHRGDRLLRGEDSDVADEIAALFRQDGVDIFLNTTAERVTKTGSQILLTAREKNRRNTNTSRLAPVGSHW
jgi:pyruvate/2-oxoglutarate dehydrogenase complex dihydrolipoamide dehydrogenase (E3) component